jgi:hypothetical protein
MPVSESVTPRGGNNGRKEIKEESATKVQGTAKAPFRRLKKIPGHTTRQAVRQLSDGVVPLRMGLLPRGVERRSGMGSCQWNAGALRGLSISRRDHVYRGHLSWGSSSQTHAQWTRYASAVRFDRRSQLGSTDWSRGSPKELQFDSPKFPQSLEEWHIKKKLRPHNYVGTYKSFRSLVHQSNEHRRLPHLLGPFGIFELLLHSTMLAHFSRVLHEQTPQDGRLSNMPHVPSPTSAVSS